MALLSELKQRDRSDLASGASSVDLALCQAPRCAFAAPAHSGPKSLLYSGARGGRAASPARLCFRRWAAEFQASPSSPNTPSFYPTAGEAKRKPLAGGLQATTAQPARQP